MAGWGSSRSYTAESGNGEVWAGEEGGGVGQDGGVDRQVSPQLHGRQAVQLDFQKAA